MMRLSLPVILFCGLASTAAVAADETRPNVVLIFIDDMGWKDTTFNGSDLYLTPNIDRLAREGMIFTDAYAAAGNCAPSRACLISGQYTPRHHVYAVASTNRGPKKHMRVNPVPNRTYLDPKNVTIAEAMKAAGYRTGMFGKWHLGKTEATSPKAQGFDVALPLNPPRAQQFKRTGDPKWVDRITNGAIKFIEDNRNRAFFAYVSHHATHMGIQARKKFYDKFAEKGPGKLHKDVKFAAMNGEMDAAVGRLMQKIKSLGLDKKTLVIFTADNGGLPRSPQTPLRGFKGMYYEGGIRVPMIARWPGTISPGTKCDVPVINQDFYATFLDLAGGKIPAGKELDGESLAPLFRGKTKLKRESIFWHFPGYLDRPNPGSREKVFRARPVTTIRKGDWKLKLYHEEWELDGGRAKVAVNNSVELFHLANDVSEKKNLAGKNIAKRDELLDDVLAWIKSTRAKLASGRNPNYAPK